MAALSILRPVLGKKTVADRAKVAMQGYLNHFMGNIDIINSREVSIHTLPVVIFDGSLM